MEIGITKTKLDNTVYDSEVTIDGYNIVQNDRNRKGGGVACYIRSNIFIDLLFPKTKPISVGIIYKPPSHTQFLELMITEFEALELNSELYILNINLLFKGKCITDKTHETKNHCIDISP